MGGEKLNNGISLLKFPGLGGRKSEIRPSKQKMCPFENQNFLFLQNTLKCMIFCTWIFGGEELENDLNFLKFLGLGGRKAKILRTFQFFKVV